MLDQALYILLAKGVRAKLTGGAEMSWLDRVKQTMEKAAGEAEEVAAVGKLKMEIRNLSGKMRDALTTIGAKVYDLHESGKSFSADIDALCKAADRLAAEIKAKEAEATKLKMG